MNIKLKFYKNILFIFLIFLSNNLFAINIKLVNNDTILNSNKTNINQFNNTYENKNINFNIVHNINKSNIIENTLKFDLKQFNKITVNKNSKRSINFKLNYLLKEFKNKYIFNLIIYKNNKKILNISIKDKKENLYFILHKSIQKLLLNLNIKKKEEVKFLTKKIIIIMNKKNKTNFYINNKDKGIYITDYTFQTKKLILNDGIFMFPKWLNKEQKKFFYTDNSKNKSILYEYNLETDKKRKILENDGLVICSDVSKYNNKYLLLTLSEHQNNKKRLNKILLHTDKKERIKKLENFQLEDSNIYLYNLQTNKKTQLTFYKGNDSTPKFINETKIAFISDRNIKPYIYIKNIGIKSNIKQLTVEYPTDDFIVTNNNNLIYRKKETNSKFAINDYNYYYYDFKNPLNNKIITLSGNNSLINISENNDNLLLFKSIDNLNNNIILYNKIIHSYQYLNTNLIKNYNIYDIQWN
jgi:TolB protein